MTAQSGAEKRTVENEDVTIYIGPEHLGYKAFFGLAGIGLGYNDQKILEAHELITAVASSQSAQPDVRFP